MSEHDSTTDAESNTIEHELNADESPTNVGERRRVIDFESAITDALEADRDPSSHRELDPRVFHPSQIGYCKRQAYLSKLGLKDTSDALGIFKAGTMIHEFMENEVAAHLPDHVVFETPVEVAIDGIKFVGHADCYDPQQGFVYDFKSRNGWYNFDPPTQRHLDQMYVYMAALDVREGRVVYVNKADPTDIEPYPESGTFEYSASRMSELIKKAKEIRDVILRDGYPSGPEEIPFEKCGCWVCNNESLAFPDDLCVGRTTMNDGEHA